MTRLARLIPDPETLMRAALKAGDDCHALTGVGNTLFVDALAGLNSRMRAELLANPSFVLGIELAPF